MVEVSKDLNKTPEKVVETEEVKEDEDETLARIDEAICEGIPKSIRTNVKKSFQKTPKRPTYRLEIRGIEEDGERELIANTLNGAGMLLSGVQWTTEDVKKVNEKFYLMYCNKKITGFIAVALDRNYVGRLFTFPDFRNRGVATLLINFVEFISTLETLQYIYCTIVPENLESIDLHKHLGWVRWRSRDTLTSQAWSKLL